MELARSIAWGGVLLLVILFRPHTLLNGMIDVGMVLGWCYLGGWGKGLSSPDGTRG